MSKEVATRQHAVKSKSSSPTTRTSAGAAVGWLSIQVLRLHGLLTEAGDAMAAPAGQTSARWQVLAAVEPAPASVADVARILNLARQSVQRVADLLVEDGLATYEENPAHRRAKLLALTAKGKSALASIQAAQATWANALGEKLDEKRVRAAAEVLGELRVLLSVPTEDE